MNRPGLLLGLALTLACSKPPPEERRKEVAVDPRAYDVSKDGRLVLSVTDAPGPVVSTAAPPPDKAVVSHPFLSASAHDPLEEDALRALLLRAKNTGEFLELLRGAGYQVSPRAAR